MNGFVSTIEPEQLVISERFDMIFVASLFSHLPEATFDRWLRRLWELLTPSGVLVFSANDAELLPKSLRAPIYYKSISEETFARDDDGSPDDSQYGSTFVTQKFVAKNLARLMPRVGQWRRFPQCLWFVQDLYIVSRGGSDLSQLNLR